LKRQQIAAIAAAEFENVQPGIALGMEAEL
jgi:hypothetical protein